MKIILNALGLILVVLIMSCATTYSIKNVSSRHDSSAHFEGLTSFDWAFVHIKGDVNPYTVENVKNAVETQLQKRAMTRTSKDPHVLIGANVGRSEKTVSRLRPAPGGGRPNGVSGEVDVYEMRKGTLTLVFIDAESKKVIWQGRATVEPSANPTPEERVEIVNEVVDRILKKFPPPSK